MYGENYHYYDNIMKKFNEDGKVEMPSKEFRPPTNAAAMRNWTSKWDTQFNERFKMPSSRSKGNNN